MEYQQELEDPTRENTAEKERDPNINYTFKKIKTPPIPTIFSQNQTHVQESASSEPMAKHFSDFKKEVMMRN